MNTSLRPVITLSGYGDLLDDFDVGDDVKHLCGGYTCLLGMSETVIE